MAVLMHYCSATPTCSGGRNDTGLWANVTCPDCLKSKPPPEAQMTWFSFECPEGCSSPTGVILSLRLPGNTYGKEGPVVNCPVCQARMRFRGSWEATEAGYGKEDGGYAYESRRLIHNLDEEGPCCEAMAKQMSYDCPQYGDSCPDLVVQLRGDERFLIAPNAMYTLAFCPWCGTRVQEDLP